MASSSTLFSVQDVRDWLDSVEGDVESAKSTKDTSESQHGPSSSTIFVPIASPPTPAPSPGPASASFSTVNPANPAPLARLHFASLASHSSNRTGNTSLRHQFLAAILADCTPSELQFVSSTIASLLKRDFLKELPVELGLHILNYVEDVRSLVRASQVSKRWWELCQDEAIWKRMCEDSRFVQHPTSSEFDEVQAIPREGSLPGWVNRDGSLLPFVPTKRPSIPPPIIPASYKQHFERKHRTTMNWRKRGRLLRTHSSPWATPDGGVVTSVAMDSEWIVVGLANCRIHVFSATTGVVSRTLLGHDNGVWAVHLVSRGGERYEPPPAKAARSTGSSSTAEDRERSTPAYNSKGLPDKLRIALGLDKEVPLPLSTDEYEKKAKISDFCYASDGWGNGSGLVVSGGCDQTLRVWSMDTGICVYVLKGHTSTVRCLRVLHNRPIAVSGSRDATLRVWDIQKGRLLRVLEGHDESVRSLDVFGNRVVSGSYDFTCRLWNVDTGECLHVLRGHLHQIYSVAYDGVHIASGGLDTMVRIWDPTTGQCLATLHAHTLLVCQLQIIGSTLVTGGSDGRIVTFSLKNMSVTQRLHAHDSSVTVLQFDSHFLVTGGSDGKVKLFEPKSGEYIRDLTQPVESVWKVCFKNDVCAIMCKRWGKTVIEIWSFRPEDGA